MPWLHFFLTARTLTNSSGNLRQVRILGKISAPTTTSARSTLCLAIWLREQQT